MICAVGIDSVAIKRFADWHQRPERELKRVFSEAEIAYCKSNVAKSAERFAARFAAKESFFKAIHGMIKQHKLPLFTVFAHVQLINYANGAPYLDVNWAYFKSVDAVVFAHHFQPNVSITHTKQIATAIVVINIQGDSK